MPTTSYTDTSFSVSAVGNRTDGSGAAVADYTAEEVRMFSGLLTEGWLSGSTAFQVRAQVTPDMSVRVGSGTARTDVYVVKGDTTGQGGYQVRLDVNTVNVTIAAADPSQVRIDEVYLVVLDNAYDATARSLPRVGYRKGDIGGANPGPDTAWKASALLARVTVAAGSTTIVTGNISEQRTNSKLTLPEVEATQKLTAAGVDLATSLAGKAAATHGHDPIATNMVGSSGNRGWSRYYSNIGEAIGSGVNQIVGYYIGIPSDPTVTWASEIPGDNFTINVSGIWAITATFRYPGVPQTGERYGSIRLGTQILTAEGGTAGANVPYTINLSWTGFLTAGVVARVWAWQTSGVTLFIDGSGENWRNINFALVRRCA